MFGAFGQVDLLWSDGSETPGVKNNGHGKEHGLFGSTIHGWECICQQFVSGLHLFSIYIYTLYIQLVDWIVHKPRTSLIVDLLFFQPTVPIKYGILHQLLQLARLLTAQKDSRRILLLCQTNVAVDGVLQSLLLVIVVLRRCMVAVSLVTKISICEGGNSKEHNDNRVRFDLIYLQQCNLVVFWWQSTMEVDVLPFWTTEDFQFTGGCYPQIPGTPTKCGCHLQDSERQLVDVMFTVALYEGKYEV